jgi:phosphoenolpyruvate phosphomutase
MHIAASSHHEHSGIAKSRSAALKDLIGSDKLEFLMEAHDAISAIIAERSGFSGIWASGLSISTALGFRDASEVSWNDVTDAVDRMAASTTVPILVDGDSGFGNFNNARILAQKLRQRGAAGICLEDKQFPKMNSFVGSRHPLADIGEFCGRLRAVKDSVKDPDFVLVARTEALIAGYGQDEALERAQAYAEAGADAILIHSRRATADQILDFARAWNNIRPVVIVPTMYYQTPVDRYRNAGISTVIWANHSIRAAVAAMRNVCGKIKREESVAEVEAEVAPLADIFNLLNYQELAAAEERYLPAADPELTTKQSHG